MKKFTYTLVVILFYALLPSDSSAQKHGVAHEWSEELLHGIRNDFARPTVHARNLFHHSIAMYDIWAAYDERAETFLLGKTVADYECAFDGITIPESETERKAAVEKALSFAMYRLINYRFRFSPGYFNIRASIDAKMEELGYDTRIDDINYTESDDPAVFGNFVAVCLIEFGLQDGANELNDYRNLSYEPVNDPLVMAFPGNPDMSDPNRWQPLTLDVFIDQAGNIIPFDTPEFLGPEWGQVVPFALSEDDLDIYSRDDFDYWVYHDPGTPPVLAVDSTQEGYLPEEYQWGYSLVSIWSSHMDPSDGVMWDISPNSLGNAGDLPPNVEAYHEYYDLIDGGDPSEGWRINPVTNEPYEVQMVPRGDYTRVLAEFWADGPDSETPPGHWFSILNEILIDSAFSYQFEGNGVLLDTLEYQVKAYFTLGGAMHDCAISAWGVKGWYDYPRPVSVIRYMASQGQSTYPDSINYHPHGMPLIDDYIELVTADDPLVRDSTDIGKVKIYAWRGPDYIQNPRRDEAGVDWIFAEEWWPYQRPSFVSPPFAGYVSGHSTFSRAAAEIMTLMTGSEYFPGGMGTFDIERDEFLVFEDGPSVDFQLQWATYRDASDQTSLSRIWGGIHPPVDDIPGRKMGIEIGLDAYAKALSYFGFMSTTPTDDLVITDDSFSCYPNPLHKGDRFVIASNSPDSDIQSVRILNINGGIIKAYDDLSQHEVSLSLPPLSDGTYFVEVLSDGLRQIEPLVIVK